MIFLMTWIINGNFLPPPSCVWTPFHLTPSPLHASLPCYSCCSLTGIPIETGGCLAMGCCFVGGGKCSGIKTPVVWTLWQRVHTFRRKEMRCDEGVCNPPPTVQWSSGCTLNERVQGVESCHTNEFLVIYGFSYRFLVEVDQLRFFNGWCQSLDNKPVNVFTFKESLLGPGLYNVVFKS